MEWDEEEVTNKPLLQNRIFSSLTLTFSIEVYSLKSHVKNGNYL
jgi:hypothetical protein